MRVSEIIPVIDYSWFTERFQVYKLRSTRKKLGYADEIFDRLASETTIVSVAFLGNGEAWVMTRRERNVTSTIREALSGRNDMAFSEEKDLKKVGDRAILQLCLCAVAGDDGIENASNLCGRLIVASLGKPNTEYFRGTTTPRVLHALEVSVSPRMELELKVKTFTSCAARHFKRSVPRFELVDGRYLRRVTSFKDADEASLFCQRAKTDDARYGGFTLLDASGPDAFSKSKLGVLRSVLVCLDSLFEGAVRVDFEDAKEDSRIEHTSSDLEDKLALVAKRFNGETMLVCDETGDLGAQAEFVAKTINSFGIQAVVENGNVGNVPSIRLVQPKGSYANETCDLYQLAGGNATTQHMTPDSGFTKESIAVAVKELAIKLDIASGRMSLIPWKWGSWEFAIKMDDEGEGSFAFLQVNEDGSMRFDGPTSVIGTSSTHGPLLNALLLNKDCEFAVRGPEGNVNVVSRTELFGVPNFETLWHDLLNRREDRKTRPNGKPMKYAIGRGKADRALYFADAVDIASCTTADGRRYYRVGMIGYGMQFNATHKASILREVIAIDGSRSLVEEMLPMLDSCLVRWGQPTVLPFPIKYLREWAAMGRRGK